MRAISHYQVNTLPSYGRLNGTRRDGWCAKLNNDEQRLQVDLGKVIEVCAVAIQGDINGNKRVIDFKLAHSKSYEDGWPTYKDADGSEAAFLGQNVLLNLEHLTFHGVVWLDSVVNGLSPGIGVYCTV